MTAVLIPHRSDNPYGLGRHVEHDPRSLAYAYGEFPPETLAAAAWTPGIGILNQGNLGKCVAESGTELLSSSFLGSPGTDHVSLTQKAMDFQAHLGYAAWPNKPNDYALDDNFSDRLYEIITRTDEVPDSYPPTDTGSSGLGLVKGLVGLGLAQPSYQHSFSLASLKSALQSGPVPIGVIWFNSMFSTTPDGHITVSSSSGVAGGHELLVCKWDPADGRFWVPNSWGTGWGVAAPAGCGSDPGGWGWFSEPDMNILFSSANQGDATVITPIRVGPQPPQPDPPKPQPPDPPQPGGNPFRTRLDAFPGLADRLAALAAHRHLTGDDAIEQYAAWKLAGDENFR